MGLFWTREKKVRECLCYYKRPRLTIRGTDQIDVLMIYILRVSSEMWLPKVRGVMLHIGALRIFALYKALYGI